MCALEHRLTANRPAMFSPGGLFWCQSFVTVGCVLLLVVDLGAAYGFAVQRAFSDERDGLSVFGDRAGAGADDLTVLL